MELSTGQLILFLVIAYASLAGSYALARKRGRNEVAWIIATLLFGPLTLLVLWLLPHGPKSPQRLKAVKVPVQASQLTHPSHEEECSVITETESAQQEPPKAESTYWHYINSEKETLGPVSFAALVEKWHTGEISSKTFVWNETMDAWQRIEALESIASFFTKSPE